MVFLGEETFSNVYGILFINDDSNSKSILFLVSTDSDIYLHI